eukprot:1141301-Pelagomonas_calceolata.AAC.1
MGYENSRKRTRTRVLSTVQQRAGQAVDPKLHTLVASTHKHLQLGSPITGVSSEQSSALRHFPTQQPLENG